MRLSVQLCASVMTVLALAGAGTDERQPAPRTAEEKAFILQQMRLFVVSIQAIGEGLSSGASAEAASAAAARGKRANATLWKPPSLAGVETEDWKRMMGAVRVGFDSVADSARAGDPVPVTLGRLADTMKGCVACHQSYRIVDAE